MKESVEKWLKEQMPDEDPVILQEIYGEYQTTAKRLLEELKEHFSANDPFELTDRTAHTLKGNALMVGDNELFEIVQQWRSDLKTGNRAACQAALPAIEAMVQNL